MTITPTRRTEVRSRPARGHYDRRLIHAILDEALVCHVGFVVEDHPIVLPTIHVRVDQTLYLHGAVGNRMFRAALGQPVCVSVTLVDGLVLARSAFHHSMNYRSVVILGRPYEVTAAEEKQRALDALVEQVMPGRGADARAPTAAERERTRVIALDITEASAKVRSGPPEDIEADHELDIWAGVIPLHVAAGTAIPDPKLRPDIPMPDYVARPPRRG